MSIKLLPWTTNVGDPNTEELERLEQAARDCGRAAAEGRGSAVQAAEAFWRLAREYRRRKHWDRAQVCREEAVWYAPDWAQTADWGENDRPHAAAEPTTPEPAVFDDSGDPRRTLWAARKLFDAGRRDEARRKCERLLADVPDHVEALLLLDHCLGRFDAERQRAFVQEHFDGHAESFDLHLLEVLKYQGPRWAAETLERFAGPPQGKLRILDLGCGTGLIGQAVKPWAAFLQGIELSSGMAAQAQRRGVYDLLEVGDAVQRLDEGHGPGVADGAAGSPFASPFDWVFAVDVLNYVGPLDVWFRSIRRCTAPGGRFAFTLETDVGSGAGRDGSERGWLWRGDGRYRHDAGYSRRAAEAAGWRWAACGETALRLERGRPVRCLGATVEADTSGDGRNISTRDG